MTTSPRATPRRRLALLLTGVLGLTMLVAPPVSSAATQHTVNVADRADFVAQTNFVQCVGASMQMMLNMIEPGRDRTRATQRRLQNLARLWSGSRPDNNQRQGASVRGWAAGLNILGAGPYRLQGEETIQEALRTAARAIATTGKPVGLLVWRGRHAWVLSGFTATADPLETDDFDVTRAIVHDPLYPHGSSIWGPSPSPGEALTVSELGRQFVPRRMNNRWSGQVSALGGKYVMVLPYELETSAFAASIR